jgi:signal transduction histidine kinase
VRERIVRYVSASQPFLERSAERDLVIEVRANRLPDGGIVTTFTDITPSVKAAEELERANESLERRVRERTEELLRLNTELGRAKGEAEQANISKTRFLAAASHDILQPLNAARLYVTSLVERQRLGEDAQLVGNIDASLDAVEILGALLDISRLDTGAMRPEIGTFRIDELLRAARGRVPAARQDKGCSSSSCPARSRSNPTAACCGDCCKTWSRTRSSTPKGRVLVGCRRHGDRLRIDVYDTGLGIPRSSSRRSSRSFTVSTRARVWRGAELRPLDRRADRAFSTQDRGRLHGRADRNSPSRFRCPPPFRRAPPDSAEVDRGQLAEPLRAVHRQRADHP